MSFRLGIESVLANFGLTVHYWLKGGHKEAEYDFGEPYPVYFPVSGFYVTATMGKWSKWWHWVYNKKTKKWKRGQKDGKGQHKGYDFACPEGTPIYASVSGIIEYAGWENPKDPKKGFGQYIRQRTTDKYKIYYAHLDTINIKPHMKVKRGQKLGYTGNTGSSTGPHLHFEVRKDLQPKAVYFQLI